MKKKQITLIACGIGILLILQGICLFYRPIVNVKTGISLKPGTIAVPDAFSGVEASSSIMKKSRNTGISQSGISNLSLSSRLNVELLGVALGSKKDPIAFIKDLNSGKQEIYRLGKTIQGAKIIEIAKGTVVVEKEGERAEISISARARAWARNNSEETPDFAQAGDTIILDKTALLSRAKDIYASARNIKVQPYKVSGKTMGMVINGIKDGGIIEAAGIQNNDIITCVNDQKIDSYQKALQVLQKVRKQNSINVSVLRDGRETQLNYRID